MQSFGEVHVTDRTNLRSKIQTCQKRFGIFTEGQPNNTSVHK